MPRGRGSLFAAKIRVTAQRYRLLKELQLASLVSGQGFSRADRGISKKGFSPCRLGLGLQCRRENYAVPEGLRTSSHLTQHSGTPAAASVLGYTESRLRRWIFSLRAPPPNSLAWFSHILFSLRLTRIFAKRKLMFIYPAFEPCAAAVAVPGRAAASSFGFASQVRIFRSRTAIEYSTGTISSVMKVATVRPPIWA